MTDDSNHPYECTHEYQRAVLERLERHVTMSVRDIAESIATADADDITEVDPATVHRVTRQLRRIHLPELEERSYVDYDRDREMVSLPGRGSDVELQPAGAGECAVELDRPDSPTVDVELSKTTLKRLHRAMAAADGLDPRMSYDEVIRRLATDT